MVQSLSLHVVFWYRCQPVFEMCVVWCSNVGLPFEESSARSSASSDSHPLSPTSSMDAPTDSTVRPHHNPLNPHHRPQPYPPHHSAHPTQSHSLSRDSSGSAGHSQRTDTLSENGDRGRTNTLGVHAHVSDDRGSDRGSDRNGPSGGLRATGVVGGSGGVQGAQHKPGSRASTQPQQTSAAPGIADSVAAATAAAAAALRPVKHGNGRTQGSSMAASTGGAGKGSAPGHPQTAPGHPQPASGSHASLPNGVSAKSSQQQQQSKQAHARTLNGNAAAFVPASVSGGMPSISSSLSLTSTGSGTLNGHAAHANHTSYRNAAAGVSTSATLAPPSTSMALP